MKTALFKTMALTAILLVLAGTAAAEKPGLIFGVKPGMLIQSSYFGLGFTKTEPYIGLDWVGVSVNADDGDASASVLIPHVGMKLLLKPRVEHQITPYFIGDLFFSLASVSVDGTSPEEEEMIQDVLEFWGLGVGFGAEYYFSDKFSAGGEYGLRYLHNGVSEHERTVDNGWGPTTETINDEFSFAFRLTYAVITLNYHL